jgi:acetylglutamate kinase
MIPSKILIKYGGNAMTHATLQGQIAEQIFRLKQSGHKVVLVHGGGPFINLALEKANIHSQFVEGQRVTSPEAFEEIQKTLIGEVNTDLVKAFNKSGIKAVGLSGLDGQTVLAEKKKLFFSHPNGQTEEKDLGRVGEISHIDPSLIDALTQEGFTPIIACIAADKNGNGYNVNADNFAGALAAALKADFYLSLTDVDGLYREFPDPESIIAHIQLHQLEELYGTVIQGGMIPKIQSIETALRLGLSKALILNGTRPEQIFQFFVEKKTIGTTITH